MKWKIFAAAALLVTMSVPISADTGYTTDQLREMALDYYEATSSSHYRPPVCDVQVNRDDSVTIHLYTIEQQGTEYEHTATSDWYFVDPLTGKGTNLMNEEIDLSPYAEGTSVTGVAAYDGFAASGESSVDMPFYGVWCEASKTLADIQRDADDLSAQGFLADVYVSTDWANLNPEFWYVMSAGKYSSEAAAQAALPHVQKFYPEAYVKYTGTYQGICPGDGRGPEESRQSAMKPFYGIWCQAAKSLSEAQAYVNELSGQGIQATVFVTTEWSNLNPEPWYVVSAGMYDSREQAEAMLPAIQRVYPEAYVKYSGDYRG